MVQTGLRLRILLCTVTPGSTGVSGAGGCGVKIMELMQLEMFVAVVEEGSVRGAAERVLRTQPAVSIAMSKLEQEFEAPLFERAKRQEHRLTQVGEALYQQAKRMLCLRTETLSTIADLRNLRIGRVRIGANESISLHLLPKLAQSFLAEHPDICLEMKSERSKSLLVDLKERKLDLALLSFKPDDNELDSRFVMQDELVLITAPTHTLTKRAQVHFEDLSEQSVLLMDVSEPSPWHRTVAEAFVQVKAQMRLTVEKAPIEAIKKMVAIGLGVSFVPRLSVEEELARGELAIVEVGGFHSERSVWLVRRRAVQSPAAKAFGQTVLAFGEQLRSRPAVSLAPAQRSAAAVVTPKGGKVVVVKQPA
jgi:DNA-binding transcriptional LysR family regulator